MNSVPGGSYVDIWLCQMLPVGWMPLSCAPRPWKISFDVFLLCMINGGTIKIKSALAFSSSVLSLADLCREGVDIEVNFLLFMGVDW